MAGWKRDLAYSFGAFAVLTSASLAQYGSFTLLPPGSGVVAMEYDAAVGWGLNFEGKRVPYEWGSDWERQIQTPGDERGEALDFNGQMFVGWYGPDRALGRAFLTEGVSTIDLGTLSGGAMSIAAGVNATGQVVGWSGTDAPDVVRAFIWEDGVMSDLGTLPGGTSSQAAAINEIGTVVGWSETAEGFRRAVVWIGQQPQDLGTLPGGAWSQANSVNELGQIAGVADDQTGARRAVVWENGSIQELGTLVGDIESIAHGMNEEGVVIGQSIGSDGSERAVLFENGDVVDLNTWMPAGYDVVLRVAYGNDNWSGIVGIATDVDGNEQGFQFGGCMSGCPDFNCDGRTNTLDFLAYLNLFSAGDPRADCDGNGTVNTLDFLCLLTNFMLCV